MSSYGQPSNSTNYNPFASDLLLDALERARIYTPEGKHLQSARRSFNLLMSSRWSNVPGPNLWRMSEVVIPLIPGVIKYFLNRNVVSVYDCYRRQYSMNGAQNYAVAFTTQIGSPNVTIAIPGNSSPVGSYIGIGIPVAVSGLVLYGFYQVVATPTVNSVTVVALSNATSSVTGGAVPTFTTVAASQNVTVTLGNHGFVPGAAFPVNVETTVGGIQLSGNYIVQSVTNANQFVIQASSNALSGQTLPENGGQVSISVQNLNAGPTDILMSPFSRTDYAAMADKTAPGPPTTLWVNKQITPEFSVWPVTDNTGPYEIHLWCQLQIQDVNPSNGQTLDLPQRFYYPCVLDLARDIAMKFSPAAVYATLKAEAAQAWADAESTDIENTSSFFLPMLPNGLN